MLYQTELSFLQSILHNYHIHTNQFSLTESSFEDMDFGLRRLLGIDAVNPLRKFLQNQIAPNIFYQITDSFYCRYILFLLPGTEPAKAMLIGPYVCQEINGQILYQLVENNNIPPALIPQLEKYFGNLPLFLDDSLISTMLNTFGEKIWGDLDNFNIKPINQNLSWRAHTTPESSLARFNDEPFISIQVLEERYAIENKIMQAVSQGQSNKAEAILSTLSLSMLEERTADPLRNLKNYVIIMNTLLRKSAENGAVHPLHIDRLSSDFARKIELLTSREAGMKLLREMIHKYCLLVKNHSMKGYSLLIQKVITQIDMDLTADLTLSALAKLQNVNASYLSTLFKKETGQTLTEYVNRKRIDHAIFLLNSTSLQIQSIAQHCGISDVNYFTKTFKKNIGTTPREYRESIQYLDS